MFEKILVAADESEHTTKALDTAAELATLAKGEIRVVHVREVALGMGGPVEVQTDSETEGFVEGIMKSLQDKGLSVSGIVRTSHTGRVAGEILEESKSWGATTIVIGSRGMTALEGLLIGSVAHKVINLANLPVVVVH